MRISDWSSDVCSSDLPHVARHSAKRIKRAAKPDEPPHPTRADLVGFEILDQVGQDEGLAGMMEEIHLGDAVAANYPCFQLMAPRPGGVVIECNEGVVDASFGSLWDAWREKQAGVWNGRSKERGVGKECVSRCRYRWWQYKQ